MNWLLRAAELCSPDLFSQDQQGLQLIGWTESRTIQRRCSRLSSPFPDVKVRGIVDGGFSPRRTFKLEVLFHVRAFVLEVKAGVDTIGDDSCAITNTLAEA